MVQPYQSRSLAQMVGVSEGTMYDIINLGIGGVTILAIGIAAFGEPNASPSPRVNYPHPVTILTNQNSNPVTISKTTIVGCTIALGMAIYCYR